MARGYAEGPAIEEAERRLQELEQGTVYAKAVDRAAVFGATSGKPEVHFIGWRDEVDPDELFAAGKAWGISVRRVPL
jgi:hypothetical protein